jgi:hypothetical protein
MEVPRKERLVLMEEDTIDCSRCESPTPESELLEMLSWWVCGECYDDL